MGCGHSINAGKSVKVSPKKEGITPKKSGKLPLPDNTHPCISMFPDFERILNGISKIRRSEITYFVACLSTNSIPIIKRSIKDFFEEDITLSLPTIGISRFEKGRIVCLGNIDYIVNLESHDGESYSFFENLLGFILGNVQKLTSILLLGLNQSDSSSIQQTFKDFKCNIEQANTIKDNDLTKYTIIFAMSNCKYGKEIYEYVRDGGRLICSASLDKSDPNDQFSINKFISKCGIGFIPVCREFDLSKKQFSNINSNSSSLERCAFPYIVGQYCSLLKSDDSEINIVNLSFLVTYFRLILPCFDRSNNPLFGDILSFSFEYLEKTNFLHEEGVFYSEAHHMISVLLSDLMIRMSPESITDKLAQKCDEIFPGIYCPEKVETEAVTIEIQPSIFQWYSTGFWLPAGVISEVEIEADNFENIFVQIGSQTDSLLISSGPYKRWPNITQLYQCDVNNQPLTIASPFGGLVYIIVDERKKDVNDQQQPQSEKITVHLTNVCKSVFIKTVNGGQNIDLHEMTDLNIEQLPPWGEIETKFVCFTLPVSDILRIEDVNGFAKYFDNLVSTLLKFVGYRKKKLFRIVFDINSPFGGSTNSYPLMLNCSSIEGIFLNEKPSSDLFAALMMIAISSFPEDCLHPNIEVSFAALSVAHTFLTKWPDVSPCQFTYTHFIPLFTELWEVYLKEGSDVFSNALCAFRQSQKEWKLEYDKSVAFIINKVSTLSGKDYSFLINDAKKLANSTPQNIPVYKLDNEEEEDKIDGNNN